MDSDRIFFVTTVTANRQPIVRRDAVARLLIEILTHYRDERNSSSANSSSARSHARAADAGAGDFAEAGYAVRQGRIFIPAEIAAVCLAGEFHESSVRDREDYEHHREVHSDESRAGEVGSEGGGVSIFIDRGRDATLSRMG